MYNNNWTDKFLKEKLKDHTNIDSIEIQKEGVVKISRKSGIPFLVFSLALENINNKLLQEIISSTDYVDFIVNIKKEYYLSEECYDFLYSRKVSFGGMSDLMRFANQEDNTFYTDPEFYFVSRSLEQHRMVQSINRLDNKRIRVERIDLKDVIVVMNNDYELNADSVRSFKSKFVDFKVMVSTNPNASITSEAIEASRSMDVDLCHWGDFFGKLNTHWT